MDKKTKRYIDLTINALILKGDLAGVLEWIQRETSISSFGDLALGYMIGGATSIAHSYIVLSEKRAITDKDKIEVSKLLRKRLPDFLEKAEREKNKHSL